MRILLRLWEGFTDPLGAARVEGDGGRMENLEEAAHSDMVSEKLQPREVVELLRMTERSGNVYENKGPSFETPERSGNVIENKHSYPKNTRMLLNIKGLFKHR